MEKQELGKVTHKVVYELLCSPPSCVCMDLILICVPKTLRTQPTDRCPCLQTLHWEGLEQIWRELQSLWKLNWHWNHSPQKLGWNLQLEPNRVTCLLKQNCQYKHPESYNIIFKISRMKSKITQHTKNQENLNSYEKRQSTTANKKMIQMLELSIKDF